MTGYDDVFMELPIRSVVEDRSLLRTVRESINERFRGVDMAKPGAVCMTMLHKADRCVCGGSIVTRASNGRDECCTGSFGN